MDIRNIPGISSLLALSALSCGDASAPPAEGAVSVSLTTSPLAGTGYACPGKVLIWSGDGVAPTISSYGTLLVDGQNDAEVSCSVKGDNDYEISGSILYEDNRVDFTGAVNATSKTGTASLSLWHTELLATLSDNSCTVDLSLGSETVESGAIWATIRCSNLMTSDDRSLWCASTTVVVFKSCDE